MQTAEKPSQATPSTRRYYKIQVKAWTNFDPSTMDLKQMAEGIERGNGSLTAIEVLKVAETLAGVDDVEVRERFETMEAVEVVMQNVDALPKAIAEKLLERLISGGDEKGKTHAA